jgi:UDP-N-acetylmuramate dehydrogenase
MQFEKNYSLKTLNTFGINVFAKYYANFCSVNDLNSLADEETFKNEKKLILGGGSNMLFTKDYDGLILKNNFKGIDILNEDENFFYVEAGAGENWHKFVLFCIEKNMAGVENLSLIPGNIGAGPMQNIGAYGVELKDTFHQLKAWNIVTKKVEIFTNTQCKFGYRESIFKREVKDQYIITQVTFKLSKIPNYKTSYGAIEQEIEKMGVKEISIKAISDAVVNIRSSKLPDPAKIGNAGSFFKNPVVEKNIFDAIKINYPELVAYPAENNCSKLAAGWLIEKAGWKGKTIANYGVHKNQALVLVNYGGAKGEEIYKLSQSILDDVEKKFGILLEREVNIY